MPRIDIDEVLREKAPRFAKYIPRFIRNWLRRTIHEEALNDILAAGWNRPPQEFIHACFREWQITYSVTGLDRLDPRGRYLFVSNHPFGGMDGMMLADKLIDRFGEPPEEAVALLDIALLRSQASEKGIAEIKQQDGRLLLTFAETDFARLSALCGDSAFKGRLLLNAGSSPYLSLRLERNERAMDMARLLVDKYSA